MNKKKLDKQKKIIINTLFSKKTFKGGTFMYNFSVPSHFSESIDEQVVVTSKDLPHPELPLEELVHFIEKNVSSGATFSSLAEKIISKRGVDLIKSDDEVIIYY